MRSPIISIIIICKLLFFTCSQTYSWGNSGHKVIHRKAVIHLPTGMNFFKAESLFFEKHSVDANSRINYSDTSLYAEWPRHYFNIDDYPNWGSLTHNIDSLIMNFGKQRIQQDGTNPWAIKWMLDSLTAQLTRKDLVTAKFTASDLGHYISDAYEPLHCTINSNGQFTGNHGIHYRYEYGMIDTFNSWINFQPASVQYINFPVNFTFDCIINSNSLVNQILEADNYSKLVSGWNGIGIPPRSYYDTLWYFTRGFTESQFKDASLAIASLWYTAWINSGMSHADDNIIMNLPRTITLNQNYPNPFNSTTQISYSLHSSQFIRLSIYDVLGREVKSLLSEYKTTGKHSVIVTADDLPSGVYFYRISTSDLHETKKFSLIK